MNDVSRHMEDGWYSKGWSGAFALVHERYVRLYELQNISIDVSWSELLHVRAIAWAAGGVPQLSSARVCPL